MIILPECRDEYLIDFIGVRKNEVVISFRDLGEIVYEGYLHTFPTEFLEEDECSELESMVIESEELKEFGIREENLSHKEVWYGRKQHVLHVKAPIKAAKILRELKISRYTESDRQSEKGFVTGKYIDQLRWCLFKFGDIVQIPQNIADVISIADQITKTYDEIDENGRADLIKDLNIKSNSWHPGNYVEYNKETGRVEVRLQDVGKFKKTVYMTPKDIRNAPTVYIDTENFFFKYSGSKTSWITLAFTENGKVASKQIYTKEKLIDEDGNPIMHFNEYDIFSGYRTFNDLAVAAAEAIREFNPFAMVGYNIYNYDLKELKKHASSGNNSSFLISQDEQPVKIDATVTSKSTKGEGESRETFYKIVSQRTAIDKMLILDLLPIAKHSLGFLENQKMQTTAQYLLREFEKSASYDELTELSRRIRKGDVAAMFETLNYVGPDVDVMLDFVLGPEKHYHNTGSVSLYSLDDDCYIADLFSLDFERLIFSRNTITTYIDRVFFEKFGVYRTTVSPIFQQKMDAETKAWARFQTRVRKSHKRFAEKRSGDMPTDTSVVAYYPWADYLRMFLMGDRFAQKYPLFHEFLNYKYSKEAMTTVEVPQDYNILFDAKRQYSLTKFMEAFLKPMAIDYMDFESVERKAEQKLKRGTIKRLKDDAEYKRSFNRFMARWRFEPQLFIETINKKAEEHTKQLINKGIIPFKTEYNGQFSFLDASSATFGEIYNCGVIPLIRFNGHVS